MKIRKDKIRIIKHSRVKQTAPKKNTPSYLPNHIEELLIFLKEPRTIDEIKAAFPQTRKPETMLKKLIGANIVFKRKFTLSGKGVKHRYNALTLFGDLAFKTYYCRFDAADEFASFIVKKQQIQPRINLGFRRSLTSHLKNLLPKEVFTVVHARMLAR